MAEHTYDFNITMTCSGCSGAVERVIKRLDGQSNRTPFSPIATKFRFLRARLHLLNLYHRCHHGMLADKLTVCPTGLGVKSYDISLENQSAHVVTDESVQYDTLLEKIKKTGKKVNSAEADGQPMDV